MEVYLFLINKGKIGSSENRTWDLIFNQVPTYSINHWAIKVIIILKSLCDFYVTNENGIFISTRMFYLFV